jgi:NAD(P)H-flavin reductase
MSDWYDVHVASRRPEGTELTHLELDVRGTPLAGTHVRAGQYIELSVPGTGESFFALAAGPRTEATHFELLVKPGGRVADALLALREGAGVQVTLPRGKGFPLDHARGHDVLLVATGSGISAIRSALELIRTERAAYGKVTLYFGARTPQAFAYGDQMAAWEADGVRVVRVVSQPGDSGWTGLTGYVQTHLAPAGPDTCVFLCGQKTMVAAVTQVLRRHGVPREHIHLNS